MSWPKVALGEVCEFRSGNAWKAKQFSDDHSGIPIIRIQNVGDEASKEYVYWTDEFDHRFLVERGDLLLSLSGSFRVARWSGPKALLNQRIVKIDPKSSVDRNWLTYALKSVVGAIEKMGRHALVNNVSMTDLRNFTLPLPPLEEQKRIAAILDKADELRRLRRRAITRLDTLVQSIFYDMFGDPFADAQSTRKSSERERSGSKLCSLGEQIMLQRGKDITKSQANEGPVPVISSGGVSFYNDTPFARGPGVLLGRKGSVGNVHFVKSDYWPHDTTLWVREFRGNSPRFVYQFFKCFPIARYEASAANPSLNRNNLHPVKVWWPPIARQNEFAEAVETTEMKMNQLNLQAVKFESLFASLQQRAFRGEL